MEPEDMKLVDKLTRGKEADDVARETEEVEANKEQIAASMQRTIEATRNKASTVSSATVETQEQYIARLKRSIKNLEFEHGDSELSTDAKLKLTTQIHNLDQELRSLGVTDID